MFEAYAARTHEKMQEVLMDPNGNGPAVHYYMIRGGSNQKNVTVWESGTVSGEYIKTYGHYHVGDLSETYSVFQISQHSYSPSALLDTARTLPLYGRTSPSRQALLPLSLHAAQASSTLR